MPKLSVRGNATYDGHDDKTSPLTIAYVVTDTFPGGTAVTPRYSEDRVRLDGGADYALAHWLKIGVGGKLDDIHYGPGQVVTWTQNAESWGRATITPIAPLSFTLKIGNGLRKASSFDAAALPPEENPLIRAYDYAPRDRVFSSLTGAWTATSTLTWSVEGSIAKDDYRSSPLGLQAVHEAARVDHAHLDTARYVERLYRRRIRAAVQSAERVYRDSTRRPGSPRTPSASGTWASADAGFRRSAGRSSLDYLMAPSYDNTDTTGRRPAAGVSAELDQARFHPARPRLPMDLRHADPFSLYARDLQLQRLGAQRRGALDRAESARARNSALSRQREPVCDHGALSIRARQCAARRAMSLGPPWSDGLARHTPAGRSRPSPALAGPGLAAAVRRGFLATRPPFLIAR